MSGCGREAKSLLVEHAPVKQASFPMTMGRQSTDPPIVVLMLIDMRSNTNSAHSISLMPALSRFFKDLQ